MLRNKQFPIATQCLSGREKQVPRLGEPSERTDTQQADRQTLARQMLTTGAGFSRLRPPLQAQGCLTWHPGALHILGLPDWTCNGNEQSILNCFHMDHKAPMSCIHSLWCKKSRTITSYMHSCYHKDQRAAALPLLRETHAPGFSEHKDC